MNKLLEKTVEKGIEILDDNNLPMQERADKTVEMQERLGATPSSKTRRQVTWFLLTFISLWFSVLMVYRVVGQKEIATDIFEYLKEYCSNSVIITIVAFFFGGYYINKIASPRVKEVLEKRKQKRAHEQIEFDLKMKDRENKSDHRESRRERRRRRKIERH